ncbi:MAG TPA: NIPSNAP family protein [Verrucomicrobiales bacterium]|nr:NIPSNAP family protein [Verrucomicrobiales bacterium]
MNRLAPPLFAAVFLGIAGVLPTFFADVNASSSSLAPGQRCFELRTYYTHPGKLEDLHKRFREHTNALFVKHGMTLVGYWTPDDKPEVLIYLLAYPSREAREKAWKGFMEDPVWKKAYEESHKDGPIVMKVESEFLQATDYSPLQ